MTTQVIKSHGAQPAHTSHVQEEREEEDFAQQQEESPLEVTSSVQRTPSVMERQSPPELDTNYDVDEPPPPYEELAGTLEDAPQIAPIGYSIENSPQTLVQQAGPILEPAPRSPARMGSQHPHISPVERARSPSTPSDIGVIHAGPDSQATSSSNGSVPRPLLSQISQSPSNAIFSSAKAKEAGFEIEKPFTPRRSDSSNSFPNAIVLPSTEVPVHTCETGKVKAYLIPFPKPRLRNIRSEEIPDRFLIYTPPLPPLSKPAEGEKESAWHKTQRAWQEDVRKAMVTKSSKATWKGIKAGTTSLIHRGVNMTRSSTVEFLDRASGGAIMSTTEDLPVDETTNPASDASPSESISPILASARATPVSPSEGSLRPPAPLRTLSSVSTNKEHKPQAIEELTLIYPPSLNLTPNRIRTEFADTLMRTRDKSRKEALLASAFLPFAATIDACLIVTFGGLTQISGTWAYTNTRGAMASKKLARGLERGERRASEALEHHDDTEIIGCTCGHHEHDFGHLEHVPTDLDKKDKKGKKKGIDLQLQQSTHLEVLCRYLDLACLKKDFNMFPTIGEVAGDISEKSVLDAIGWAPVRRRGRDLQLEYKDRVETFTPEQDEQYQTTEAMDDIKRYMRKGATEWVAWLKMFQKDPKGAVKK